MSYEKPKAVKNGRIRTLKMADWAGPSGMAEFLPLAWNLRTDFAEVLMFL